MSDHKVDVVGEGLHDFSAIARVGYDQLKPFPAFAPASDEFHKVLFCEILSKQCQCTDVSMTGEMQAGGVVESQVPRQVSGAGEETVFENHLIFPRL